MSDDRSKLQELRRIDELERKASGSKAEPAPVSKPEASLGEHLYGGAYGLGTGLLGGVGDIESMVTPTSTEPKLRGYETVFPTTENVRGGLTKLGVPKPAPGTEASVTLGEYAPAIAGGTSLIKTLGTAGYRKASDLANTLLGKKTTAQAEQVFKAARGAEETGGKALTVAEKEQERLLSQQQAKITAEQEAQKTRQTMAETAGTKAEAKGGRSLRELAGVRTLPEAGGFKPIPQTPTQVGNFIREQAENFVKSIKTQRDAAAKTSFANAKNEASLKQSLGQYVDTAPLTAEIDQLIAKGGSTDYIRSISQLKGDLAATKDFEGLEIIRRRLGDAAYGLPEEGYKAIGQGFAKEMYKSLAGQMRSYSSDFAKYLDDYKKLSKTIEAHGTKVGKGLTETQDAAGKYYAKTAEQVANDIFSSPEKYKTFVDAVGGNKQIAEAAARRYFAGLAETAKTPKAVEDLLRKSRAVLDEMPAVRKEITDRYLGSLKQSERRATAASQISEQSQAAQKAMTKQADEIDKQVTGKLKGIAEGKKLFSDSVEALASAKPNAAIKTFEETVLPKIRAAEQKAGTQLLSEKQIQALRQQVQELEKISDKTTRTRVITGVLATYFIGQEGVSRIGKLAGMPSGE
jgi:hypothetical protein